jgi:hypothetical protein
MKTSPDTLLRRIRGTVCQARSTPQVLGVDDWAVRRRQRYGTLLCDLENHCAVDLLDDRSAMTLANWLLLHPGVQIITRDRAGNYARGASTGAPQAIQVADRFHLLQNVREALVRAVDRHSCCLREVARKIVAYPERGPPNTSPQPNVDQPPPAKRGAQRQEARRTKRLEQYRQVKALNGKGLSLRALAKSQGLSRRTVRRYLRADGFPERAARFCPK